VRFGAKRKKNAAKSKTKSINIRSNGIDKTVSNY
jgi:hypothetical protein